MRKPEKPACRMEGPPPDKRRRQQPSRASRAAPGVQALLHGGGGLPKKANVLPQLGWQREAVPVLDQGERGTCCAHAVTACHQLLRGPTQSTLTWSDVHCAGWEDTTTLHAGNRFVGALVKECAVFAGWCNPPSRRRPSATIERVGQRLEQCMQDHAAPRYRARFVALKAGNLDAAKLHLASGRPLAV